MKTKAQIFRGAWYGAKVWLVYWILECLFYAVLPAFIQPDTFIQLRFSFLLILLGVYLLTGLLLGTAPGLVRSVLPAHSSLPANRRSRPECSSLPMVGLVLIFATNFARSADHGLSMWVVLAGIGALIVALSAIVASDTLANHLRCFYDPWTLSLLLLGPSWIAWHLLHYDESELLNLAFTSVVVCIVLIALLLTDRNKAPVNECDSSISTLFLSNKTAVVLPAFFVAVVLGAYWFNLPRGRYTTDLHRHPNAASSERPNVLLIVLDTVRADHLSAYRYERDTTPNLTQFCKNATLYRRAVATSDVTTTTHASILTGIYARGHGSHYDPPDHPGIKPLDGGFKTLTECLSDDGYGTMAVVSNGSHLARHFNLHQGFYYYDIRLNIKFLQPPETFYISYGVYAGLKAVLPRAATDLWYRRAETINDEVFEQLNNVRADGRT